MPGVFRFLLGMPFSVRQRRLAQKRERLNEEEFVRRIVDLGGDAPAAHLLWRRLGEWMCAEGFSPYPSDSLKSIFGMAEEELDDDLVFSTLGELGVPPPNEEALRAFGVVDTPARVALLVALCRGRDGGPSPK